jgi:hypothetical protein
MTKLISTCLAVLLGVSVSAPASAQIAAAIQGRVADPTSAAIPNAHIELTQLSTGLHTLTTSSSAGDYTFPQLVPGQYRLAASAPGFNPLLRPSITVSVGGTTVVDLTLPIGTGRDTVTVTADAPILQAAVADIQTTVPGNLIAATPLNTRNFVQLATLAPGVELPPGTLLPRINGGRPRTNEYLFDGISALQPEPGQVVFFPILDDIAEFTVQANNVPAEFGRFNGGVVNVATRSGSSAFHGSLFEYLRNEDLNARNYFSTAAVSPQKPEYRRNLYGATLSGPILLPHQAQARLFFFADYQGVKQLIGKTVTSTVPTLAERQGIFPASSPIYDPTSSTIVAGKTVRTQFPGNTINRPFDPAALALLARIPTPTNLTAAANNYTRTANDTDHQNQFDLRLDAALTPHDRAFARYSYYNEVEQPVTPFPEGSGLVNNPVIGTGGVPGLSNVLGQQGVLGETHTFTPHLLNDARLGYTRRGNSTVGPTLGNTASTALGIPGIPTNAAFSNALPLFTFTGFQQLGPSASTFANFTTIVTQLTDTLLFTRGRNQFKLGADIRFYQLNSVAPPNPTGSFAFTTTGTDQQGLTGSGNAFASFLLGQVDTFSIDLQTAKLRPRDHIQEYFFQDDLRASSRLTLNLGTRWTLHAPSTEANNHGAVFNLATQQLDYAGVNGNSRSARTLHFTNLAPRVGLTYMVAPKTVLRSGFGIVFIDQSGITTPFTLPQFPFIQNVQQATTDSVTSPFTLSNGPTVAPIALTPNAGLGQSVYTADRNAGSGYVQQWNLALQRSLTNSLSIDIAYVGSHIVHIGIPDSNLNQLTAQQLALGATLQTKVANPYAGQLPGSLGAATISQAQLLKPYPRFQNVAYYRHNSGTSNYNGLEAKVEQRLSHGLSLLFSYTHSRLLDDAGSVFSSTVLSSPNTSSLVAADTFRPYLERDVSTGDMTNVTSAAFTYNLDALAAVFKSSSPPSKNSGAPSIRRSLPDGWATTTARTLLSGWSIDAITQLQSGMPITITQATNNNAFAGFVLQRPNLIANPTLTPAARYPARFFNTAAFATAPAFTLGNASRNPVRGPAYRDLDIALIKHTHLPRNTDLEFRAELFDITNTPAFAQPNGSFGSAAFGSITATTTDPRVAQFALRLTR